MAQAALEPRESTETTPQPRDHFTNLPEEILLAILQLSHLHDEAFDPNTNKWTVSLLNRRFKSHVQPFPWRRVTRGQPQLVEQPDWRIAGGYKNMSRGNSRFPIHFDQPCALMHCMGSCFEIGDWARTSGSLTCAISSNIHL